MLGRVAGRVAWWASLLSASAALGCQSSESDGPENGASGGSGAGSGTGGAEGGTAQGGSIQGGTSGAGQGGASTGGGAGTSAAGASSGGANGAGAPDGGSTDGGIPGSSGSDDGGAPPEVGGDGGATASDAGSANAGSPGSAGSADGDCSEPPECETIGDRCVVRVSAVYRDFNPMEEPNGHPDFEPVLAVHDMVTSGLVEDLLDAEGKPVSTGLMQGGITSAASFSEWYRSSTAIPGEILLFESESGGFVNRWRDDGTQWVGYPGASGMGDAVFDFCDTLENGGCSSPLCVPTADILCVPCSVAWGTVSTDSCIATEVRYDGNPVFFPIDPPTPGILEGERFVSLLPPAYGANYDEEPPVPPATESPLHNFYFTSEIRFWFRYDASRLLSLAATGDDDLWAFVNGRLAIDLGGGHLPLDASAEIDPDTFGLVDAETYEIAVFHAERGRSGSALRLHLTGATPLPGPCMAAN